MKFGFRIERSPGDEVYPSGHIKKYDVFDLFSALVMRRVPARIFKIIWMSVFIPLTPDAEKWQHAQ